MGTKSEHEKVINKFYEKYSKFEIGNNEFTWDGPSNWEKWEKEKPKILFLAKESRLGGHPSVANQKVIGKFPKNIARWKMVIKSLYFDPNSNVCFPKDNELPQNNDDIAIIEVKKLNEENWSSNNKVIESYAKEDAELLRQQIDLIDPDIVLCMNTFNSYDIIYNYTYEIEEKLIEMENLSCWNVNNRLIIEFRHASTFPQNQDPNQQDYRLFNILIQMMKDKNVQHNLRK